MLCRTSRLFFLLQRAFAERGDPGRGRGARRAAAHCPRSSRCWRTPAPPTTRWRSVALARILMGPRYRVGFKDLALVAGWAKGKNYAWREEGGDDEDTPFLFAEALEHLDEVEGLSEEGRARLEEFRDELADAAVEARRPVAEFLGEVIRRIGIIDELDADVDRVVGGPARHATSRRSWSRCTASSPSRASSRCARSSTTSTRSRRWSKEEWEPVQPTDEDAVKVMTIHQAKGLEFDHVFVPGVATGLLPSRRIQQNPAERGYSLDFELRGDAADPAPVRRRALALQARPAASRRSSRNGARCTSRSPARGARSGSAPAPGTARTCNAKGPSEFFAELAAWGRQRRGRR